ncbi:Olfactory receptor 10AG1 [Heterocephalus glaber]|uniref:Olfactory receptor 10AG1 n=1 Tax=Heterocephalus glaber TaxID=10181 RepID=G5BK83_HETGA|nr:Olfactory receptor 10AG1 [Heterocephalus glaber]
MNHCGQEAATFLLVAVSVAAPAAERRNAGEDSPRQMGFLLVLGAVECFLLVVMAYDHYTAICNPLEYPLIMNLKVCTQLVTGSWILSFQVQMGQTVEIFTLSFCGSHIINHFCDITPVLNLACGNILVNKLMVYTMAFLIVILPFMLILVSYSRIISTILRLPSNTGRAKAFSTCSSHLIVVILFYGSAGITYLYSMSSQYESIDKLLALFYTILTPLFNPMRYSLLNKDVIRAL